MPLAAIKDFNTLIDSKLFFNQPIKSKQEEFEKYVENQEMMIRE